MAVAEKNRNVIAGLFIAAGIMLLLSNLDIIDFNITHYIFRWQSILIFVGLLMFFKNENKNGIVLIAVGGVFLVSEIVSDIYIRLFDLWPVGIIIIGAFFIKKDRVTEREVVSEQLNEMAFFGGNKISAWCC